MARVIRPAFHVTPPTGWLNDPNGLIYDQGEYHLFYQWSPALAVSADAHEMHWAHAVSANLLNWEHLPVVLSPDALGAIWSGSVVADVQNTSGFFDGVAGGGLVAIFTHHDPANNAERQSLAYSTDRGRTFTKYGGNPVLGDSTTKDFRDPKVFWHEPTAQWVMLVGCQHRLYGSADLKSWRLLQELPYRSECPDLFRVPLEDGSDERWVLSLGGREVVVGGFDGRQFVAEGPAQTVDGGLDFYATQAWNNCLPRSKPLGGKMVRALWIGWLCNWKYARTVPEFGARGMMTAPRDLYLRRGADGQFKLIQKPASELARLAGKAELTDEVKPGVRLAEADCFEINAVVRVGAGDSCGFKIRVGRGAGAGAGGEATWIGLDAAAGCGFVDRTQAGLGGGVAPGGPAGAAGAGVAGLTAARFTVPLEAASFSKGEIGLRVIVDHSSVEAFFDNGAGVITSLIYPAPESRGVEWFSARGNSSVELLEIRPWR